MIITIDGPAGSGKSAVSRILARILGFEFLDSGAMYRSVTWLFLKNDIKIEKTDDQKIIEDILSGLDIRFDGNKIFVNDDDLTEIIRKTEVTKNVSPVSRLKIVRERLVALQRQIADTGDYVAEGRDMGSVVFPEAKVKFYLDAAPDERARRRADQLRAKDGDDVDVKSIKAQIIRRDEMDSKRAVSPLIIPEGAVIIDSSNLSIDEVVEKMLSYISKVDARKYP